MKCIRCGTDNNLRERTDNRGLCKNCQHPFAFEPAIMTGVKFTDPFFAKAIADISDNNTLYFTPRQLFYWLRKRLKNKDNKGAVNNFFFYGFIVVFVGIVNYKVPTIFLGSIIFGLLLIIGAVLYVNQRRAVSLEISQDQFQSWVNSWLRVNEISKMLHSVRDEITSSPVNPDISTYSFDRAVICDRAEIAQLLIANNFHFENNCAVLSITGYPQSIFSTVMQMLRRNPDLKVYAIHDATPSGVSLVYNLRNSSDWFENSTVMIYEVGLLPRQFFKNSKLLAQVSEESALQAQQLPAEVRQSLSINELKWLEAGKFVELESFSTRKLIQILNQAISQSQNLNVDDGLVVIDEGYDYVYATESFG